MKKFKYMLCIALAVIGFAVVPASVTYAAVDKVDIKDAQEITATEACKVQGSKKECKSNNALSNIIVTVTNVILFLVGAVAVIMIIVGGFRYVTSNGDQNAVTGAKNTILYAIIGIIVAFLAYAAVQFIVGSLTDTSTKGDKKSSSIHKTAMV
ncbi:hypothetical protein HY004_02480 [Candidatus Saccharibacteria bacterium]|nr:hypothetical protein [Candidatus Saccharibacteria bacterium]